MATIIPGPAEEMTGAGEEEEPCNREPKRVPLSHTCVIATGGGVCLSAFLTTHDTAAHSCLAPPCQDGTMGAVSPLVDDGHLLIARKKSKNREWQQAAAAKANEMLTENTAENCC